MRHPLQVFMDDDELRRLERWSRERGWTKSQAVRAAVRALTRGRAADPILEASGMIDGLPRDLSERFDAYLEETFIARKRPTATPSRTRRSGASVRR